MNFTFFILLPGSPLGPFILLIDPFADQRGFTKASGGRDEGQFASKTKVLDQALVQPLDQAGAEETLGRGRGI